MERQIEKEIAKMTKEKPFVVSGRMFFSTEEYLEAMRKRKAEADFNNKEDK